jgi:hypothetical protein
MSALLAVLAVRLGPVERVSYNLAEWDPAARKIHLDGHLVRLGGYHSQRADTVDVIAEKQRITLLVVPPEAPAEAAHQALMTASHRGNIDSVEKLLASGGATSAEPVMPAADDPQDVAVQRWELDGGRVNGRN